MSEKKEKKTNIKPFFTIRIYPTSKGITAAVYAGIKSLFKIKL